MKTLYLIPLLALTSCALYTEIVTPAKRKSPETEASSPVEPIRTSNVTYEDAISKNWDYRRQLGTYTAMTVSQNKKASLIILRDSSARISAGIQILGAKLKYRPGHSVEVKIDDAFTIQKVEPTDSDSIKFSDGQNFAGSLKGKKQLTVEVLGDEGPKKYTFDISGLQDFFTTI